MNVIDSKDLERDLRETSHHALAPSLERDLNRAQIMERLWIFGRLAARTGEVLRRLIAWPFLFVTLLRTKASDELLIAPQDIRTADATIAADIYAGYFAFAGKIVNAHGRSPFEIEAQAPEWERGLNAFGWLRHLRAADSALAKANARALVDDFLRHSGKRWEGAAWEPRIIARRLISFLAQSPMILDGADHDFYRRFMRGLARAQYFLEYKFGIGLKGEDRLLAAIALAELSLCANGMTRLRRRSARLLAHELDHQVLPDGGHVSRNPGVLIDLMLDLLPLRQLYAAQAIVPPQPLLNAIDRILPMLRLLCHGDGTLALFNGMGVTAPDLLATALSYDDLCAKPLFNAPYTGYQRVEAGASVLTVDTGSIPPPEFSSVAHAGCLSFEWSIGTQKLVVNCGAPSPLHTTARALARTTAAHSTLVVADTSSCRFAGSHALEGWFKDQILAGPRRVAVERQQAPNKIRLRLAHDGYLRRFGLIHDRRLTISSDGLRLDGEDRLRPARRSASLPQLRYALRFHIHPALWLEPAEEHRAVLITLPDERRFIFETLDAPIAVEESIYFAAADGPRACEQIVIYGDSAQKTHIAWRFRPLVATEPVEAEKGKADAATPEASDPD